MIELVLAVIAHIRDARTVAFPARHHNVHIITSGNANVFAINGKPNNSNSMAFRAGRASAFHG